MTQDTKDVVIPVKSSVVTVERTVVPTADQQPGSIKKAENTQAHMAELKREAELGETLPLVPDIIPIQGAKVISPTDMKITALEADGMPDAHATVKVAPVDAGNDTLPSPVVAAEIAAAYDQELEDFRDSLQPQWQKLYGDIFNKAKSTTNYSQEDFEVWFGECAEYLSSKYKPGEAFPTYLENTSEGSLEHLFATEFAKLAQPIIESNPSGEVFIPAEEREEDISAVPQINRSTFGLSPDFISPKIRYSDEAVTLAGMQAQAQGIRRNTPEYDEAVDSIAKDLTEGAEALGISPLKFSERQTQIAQEVKNVEKAIEERGKLQTKEGEEMAKAHPYLMAKALWEAKNLGRLRRAVEGNIIDKSDKQIALAILTAKTESDNARAIIDSNDPSITDEQKNVARVALGKAQGDIKSHQREVKIRGKVFDKNKDATEEDLEAMRLARKVAQEKDLEKKNLKWEKTIQQFKNLAATHYKNWDVFLEEFNKVPDSPLLAWNSRVENFLKKSLKKKSAAMILELFIMLGLVVISDATNQVG